MSTLLIGYDLNKPAQNYEGLIDYLKDFDEWWHHLDSTWLIKTEKTPAEVRNDIGAIVDADDQVLVIDVSGDARAWRGFDDKGSKWLKETY